MFEQISSTRFIDYKLKGRRPSILTMENPQNDKQSWFIPNSDVCQTRRNQIREFQNVDAECLIVKSPNADIVSVNYGSQKEFEETCADEEREISREFNFQRQAYPDDKPCRLVSGIYTYNTPHGAYSLWTFRLIMPMFSGQTLDWFIPRIKEPQKLLAFFLAICMELKRIHELGVIHGDVFYDNVFATEEKNDFVVRFIDFGSAYSIQDSECIMTTDADVKRWAPERTDDYLSSAPAPDTSQDIYSLGYMFIELLQKSPKFKYDNGRFKKYFPGLFSGIKKTQSDDPAKRPKMKEIITQINEESNRLSR